MFIRTVIMNHAALYIISQTLTLIKPAIDIWLSVSALRKWCLPTKLVLQRNDDVKIKTLRPLCIV